MVNFTFTFTVKPWVILTAWDVSVHAAHCAMECRVCNLVKKIVEKIGLLVGQWDVGY
jgi:hypothetical protein